MRRVLIALSVLLVGFATTAACSTTDTATQTTTPTKPVDCERLANAVCSAVDACGFIDFSWGGKAECLRQKTQSCAVVSSLPDTGLTADFAVACGDALTKSACGNRANCDPTPGRRSLGAECVVAEQCESLRCLTDGKGSCGVCASTPKLGDNCDFPCRPGLRCIAGSDGKGICAQPKAEGQPCVSKKEDPCAFPSQCIGGMCTLPVPRGGDCSGEKRCELPNHCADGVCVAPLPEGAPCNAGREGECDPSQLLRCSTAVGVPNGAPTCRKYEVAAPHEACGKVDCVGRCVVGATSGEGTCEPYVLMGGDCTIDTQGLSLCAGDAKCVMGTCVLAYPTCP